MNRNGLRPIHPGEILREDFLKPLVMSAHILTTELHITQVLINAIVNEDRGISTDLAVRLARYFGGDAQSWLNLQQTYDLKIAEKIARAQFPPITQIQ
jgi:addiction module HigA family antidote